MKLDAVQGLFQRQLRGRQMLFCDCSFIINNPARKTCNGISSPNM